jgi:hypothetical protein
MSGWVFLGEGPLRKCEVCGGLFMRHVSGVWSGARRVRRESPAAFEKRNYCSRKCAFALQKQAHACVRMKQEK